MFEIARILYLLVVAAVLLATLVPLSKIPHGAIRGPEFLRMQTFFTLVALGLIAPMMLDGGALWWTLAALVAGAVLNAAFIVKFTPLWPVQSARPGDDIADLPARSVSILASNVKLSNRDYGRFVTMIENETPDILIAVEVDDAWIEGISRVRGGFDDHVEVPLNTGYGMLVWSRLPLRQVRVADRVTEGVPSIRAAVQLPSGAWFRLYAVHPEPPVAEHDTKGRDSEIALAGIEARDDPLPAIVTGDLNDVAWSTTTRRFQRLSGLLDPRIGRGLYNTFSAFYPIFRWPLDHLFHDPKFRLVEMRRLPPIGSDHFPMLFRLALTSTDGDSELPDPPDPEEEEEVAEMIDEEKHTRREAIGSDWEKG